MVLPRAGWTAGEVHAVPRERGLSRSVVLPLAGLSAGGRAHVLVIEWGAVLFHAGLSAGKVHARPGMMVVCGAALGWLVRGGTCTRP